MYIVKPRGKRRLLVSAVAAVIGGGGGHLALAQEVPAANGNLEQITVTGSRIQRDIGFDTPTPVTSLSADELVSFEPGGTLTDALNALPQMTTTSAREANGALGTFTGNSSVNMRGLGANRTLVLLDGARVVPADRTSTVNTDLFPTALMQRVDVVTGGATAAYGAAALAGATNFMLDRRFEGFRASVRTGTTEEGDGDNYNLSFAGGRALGSRTHVIFS